MKVSDLIRQLELYIQHCGDDEVEFTVFHEDEDLKFYKVHPGYNGGIGRGSLYERVCEIRLEWEE